MARPNPIEREPGNGPERARNDRMNILRNPDVSPEQQRQVADALNVIAESELVDTVVKALGLQTDLSKGPVHDFLVNNGPARVAPLFDAAFEKAEAELRASNNVPGALSLKQTQARVRKILSQQPGEAPRAA